MIKRDFADLTGQTALVTGATGGIGRALVKEFAAAGADVLVHSRRRSVAHAEVLADELRAFGSQAQVLTADLSDPTQLNEFVDRAWDCLDGVDIWVNNAGAYLLGGEPATWPYHRKLQELLDVDIRATVLLSKQVGPRMITRKGATILNIGWDQAQHGMEGDSGELFAVAKNAIMGFTKSLAVSLAPHVRVNCIAPGWIRTAWGEQASEEWQERVMRETPLKRWGTPADIAALARFLVSPEADYLTGQVINANGGAIR
jgi:3-oxoacyl-[acyl-carrier protein] reductase